MGEHEARHAESRRVAVALCLVAAALTVVGCSLTDDVARNADDIARVVARQAGKAPSAEDDIARMLRGVTSTEDDAVRLGERLSQAQFSSSAGRGQVQSAIASAISGLSAEDEQKVVGVALSVVCDGLDAVAAGESFDAGQALIEGIGGLNERINAEQLKQQVEDLIAQLTTSDPNDISGPRVSIMAACILASLD